MDCPICKQPMEVVKDEISHNPRDDKKYSRILYVCKKDDVWVTTEIPKTD